MRYTEDNDREWFEAMRAAHVGTYGCAFVMYTVVDGEGVQELIPPDLISITVPKGGVPRVGLRG